MPELSAAVQDEIKTDFMRENKNPRTVDKTALTAIIASGEQWVETNLAAGRAAVQNRSALTVPDADDILIRIIRKKAGA